MREIITDIVNHCSLFDTIRVTGTEDQTRFQAVVGNDKNFFFDAYSKTPIKEFSGQFGLNDIPMLGGLLGLSCYKTEGGTIGVKREVKGGAETVTEIQLRDVNGAGSNFKTMMAALVGGQAQVGKVDWDITFSPVKARVSEFTQLAGLYGKIRDLFSIDMVEGNLVFSVGSNNASTHSATMVFATDLGEDVDFKKFEFSLARFLSVLKMAGNNTTKISITRMGLMKISVETPHADYGYYIRPERASA